MKDGKYVIGLDIDNVLNDCALWFIEYAEREFGIAIDYGTKTAYSWSKYLTPEQEAQILNEGHLYFGSMRVRELAVHFLQTVHAICNCKSQKIRFVYITDRRFTGFQHKELLNLPPREITYNETMQWLLNHGFPVHALYLEGDNGGKTKGELALAEGVDIFIEDSTGKAEDIASYIGTDTGIESVWLLLQPWNRLVYTDDDPAKDIRYVADWSEIAMLFLNEWQRYGFVEKNEYDALNTYIKDTF